MDTRPGTKVETDFTNEFIERLLVRRCLSDKKYIGIISGMFDRRWFDNDRACKILNLAINYYNKFNSVPSNPVLMEMVKKFCEKNTNVSLSDMSQELRTIHEINSDIPDDVVKTNLQGFIESKAMYWTISDNIATIEKDKNVDTCIDRFNKIRKMSLEDTDLGMNYFSPDAMAKHWEYIMNPEAKIKTMWPGLDAMTNGGFLKTGKELVCFCGQAGLGKSLFLSNLSVNFLKQNLSVVVISLEMSQDVYAKRFDAHISEHNVNTLFRTKDSTIANIRDFYNKYPGGNLYIKEYPPRTIKVSDIENYLETLRDNGAKIDVIVIDYLNLVLSNKKSDSMYESVMDVAEKLRALSYKFEAPVITATQANTQGMNNENIGMEHISESKGIAHTVDELFMLFQMDDDRERGEIKLRIAKNRAGGQVGKVITFKLNPESLVLSDASFTRDGHPEDDNSETDSIIGNLSNISSDLEEV